MATYFRDHDRHAFRRSRYRVGFVIVSKVSDEKGVRTYPRTKRQWNKPFLEKLVRGLNNDPASKAYKISLNVLRKYEFAI